MSEKCIKTLKKLWHDPVWSKVIATALLSVPTVYSYFAGWWPAIGQFLLNTINIPNWLLMILALLSFFMVVLILVAIYSAIFPSLAVQDWRSYTSDNFFDVSWQWNYNMGSELNIYKDHIIPRCPKCQTSLDVADPDIYEAPDFLSNEMMLLCHHCGFKKQFIFEFPILLDRVIREIDRKIVTGEYKALLKRESENRKTN